MKTNFKDILRSLNYRNYRLFFAGQGISLIGTWMQQIALSWLVYKLTNSALLLGLVGFFSQIPFFVITPFAGVLVDRLNRHRILVATQTLSMIQAFILAFLTLTGHIQVWHIVSLSLGLGLVNAFDWPARQVFVIDIVEKKEDLSNAIALNSAMFNGARLIGPAVAGILVAAVGEGMCFLINGISFIAVIIVLLSMKVKKILFKVSTNNIPKDIREGFKYSFGFSPIRSILLLLGLVSLMGMPFTVLMPIFAKDILHGNSNTQGFLMASVGIGAIIGSVYLAYRKTVAGLSKIVAFSTGIFGAGLVAFSLSKNLWLSLFMILIVGFGMVVQLTSSNTILQTITEEDKRGRVLSFFALSVMGMSPFGNLLAGVLANKIGAPNTILISGAFCMLGAIVFSTRIPLFRKIVHPIYIKKGIIPGITKKDLNSK